MTKPNATAPETRMNRVGDFPSILARPHIFWMVSYITNALWKSASITPTRPARSIMYLVYAISWGFGSRREFGILPIADYLSLTAAPFTPP